MHPIECAMIQEEHLAVEFLEILAPSASAYRSSCQDRAFLCVPCEFQAHPRAHAVVRTDRVGFIDRYESPGMTVLGFQDVYRAPRDIILMCAVYAPV